MAVWERYKAERSKSAQAKSHEERVAEIQRDIDRDNAAKHAVEQKKTDARETASLSLFKSTNTLGMLGEIADHVPGAKVSVEDRGGGFLTASVKWERDVNVHDLHTGKNTTRRVEYGVEVGYGDPATGHPQGYLTVDNLGGSDGHSFSSSDLEGKLAEAVVTQLDRTGKPIETSSGPQAPGRVSSNYDHSAGGWG